MSDLGSLRAHLDPKSSNGKLTSGPNTHTQLLAGVPKSMCEANHWSFQVNAGVNLAGTLALGPPEFTPQSSGDAPTCRFLLTFTPDPPSPGGSPMSHVTLGYSLISKAGTNALTVPTDAVDLSTGGLPKVGDNTSDGVYTRGERKSGGHTFEDFIWPLIFPVLQDPKDVVDVTGSVPDEISLSCPGRPISPLSAQLQYSSGTSSLTLTPKHTAVESEKLDLATDEVCQIAGRISLTLKSGLVLSRDLPATLVYYTAKQKEGHR